MVIHNYYNHIMGEMERIRRAGRVPRILLVKPHVIKAIMAELKERFGHAGLDQTPLILFGLKVKVWSEMESDLMVKDDM